MRPIDADALLRTIESIERGNELLIEFYLETKVLLDNAPTIEAEPARHGRWIHYPDCGTTVCSDCRWSIEMCWDSEYCPHCCAKMDGKEEKNGTD